MSEVAFVSQVSFVLWEFLRSIYSYGLTVNTSPKTKFLLDTFSYYNE